MAAQLSSSSLGKSVPFSVSFPLENGNDGDDDANLSTFFCKIGYEGPNDIMESEHFETL